METPEDAIIELPYNGEFVDDALEGVDPRPPADQSEIVTTHLLDEFVDDAAAFPLPPSQGATPESEVLTRE
jgi:hypothetical protein